MTKMRAISAWLVMLLGVSWLAAADVETSFENCPGGNPFTLGTPPKTVTFAGGECKTIGNFSLYHTGTHSWMVSSGQTGVITFETPARELRFFFRDQNSTVRSRLTLKDASGQVLSILDGTQLAWQEVNLKDTSVARIELENRTGMAGSYTLMEATPQVAPYTVIDDFSFTAQEPEPQLEVVDVFYFPLLADGTAGDPAGQGAIRFQTEINLLNTGEAATLELEFRDRAGNPLELDLGLLDGAAAFLFELPLEKGEGLSVVTSGLGGIRTGYAIVRVKRPQGSAPAQAGSGGVGGTAVFTRLDVSANVATIVTEAGVPAVRPVQDFTLFLDSRGPRDTGLALLNPPPEGAGAAEAATVTLSVYDRSFQNLLGQEVTVLAEGQAVSRFINEFFADNPALAETLRETEAVVTVSSTRGLAPATIRQNDDTSIPFPQDIPTLTAFPVVAGRADGQTPASASPPR